MNDHEVTKNTSPINFDNIKARLRDTPRRRGKSLIELIAEKYAVTDGVNVGDVSNERPAWFGDTRKTWSKYQANTLANVEQ